MKAISKEKTWGRVALVVTLIYTGISLPMQIAQIHQTKDTSGFSKPMICMLVLTFLSWTIYSITKPKIDWYIFVSNGVGFIFATIILIQILTLS